MFKLTTFVLALGAISAPLPQAPTAPVAPATPAAPPAPVPGQIMPGAMVPTSVLNQIGDTTTQIQTQTNANAMTAIRNFFGDVALVSNAISLIGSGQVTDPGTIQRLAQVAFNGEINENDQRMVMVAAAGPQAMAQDANNNIVTFTPTVLNGLQAIAQNPTQNAQLIAQTMGTVRNARILPSITNLALAATGGSIPVSTVIQATTQASNAQSGSVQDNNSAALLALMNNGAQGGGQQQQPQQPPQQQQQPQQPQQQQPQQAQQQQQQPVQQQQQQPQQPQQQPQQAPGN